MTLVITHTSGFFSCCSVKLDNIVNYINSKGDFPDYIDCSRQFKMYKRKEGDVTYDYFEHYDCFENPMIKHIDYKEFYQFKDFSELDYNNLTPLIIKYFSPSEKINDIITNIELKYKLDYNNVCVLFYRGLDKRRETSLCRYEEYLQYSRKVISKNRNVQFLIQSDETEFIEFMRKNFPNNSFYFKDEIRHTKKCVDTVDLIMQATNHIFSKYYLSITFIMSKCKYIICGSGNCSIWIMLFRGNCNNMCQNLNGRWIDNISNK